MARTLSYASCVVLAGGHGCRNRMASPGCVSVGHAFPLGASLGGRVFSVRGPLVLVAHRAVFAECDQVASWSMALYLFLATLPCDILSGFLVFCNRLVYPFYLSTPHLFSLLPLQDQESAGALMWVWATFAYLIPAVAITLQILSPSNMQSPRPMQATQHRIAGRSLNDAQAELL
jgi:Cytochrome c oxidase caa3 assembly factor (Caa3_CtaG)